MFWAGVFGAHLAPYDYTKISLLERYKPPSSAHWCGTDNCGRDVLSRVMVVARATILSALAATALATIAGSLIGTTSVFVGGKLDEFSMRTVDAIMAIPGLLFALLIVSTLGQSSVNAVLAVAISSTPGMVRISRSVALGTKQLDYVMAARARGESNTYIVDRKSTRLNSRH